jgi:hypothetical protein
MAGTTTNHNTPPGYTRQAERDAIRRVVREGHLMVVWLSERGMIEWLPAAQGGCALFAVRPSETVGLSGADMVRGCGNLILATALPVLVIQDVTGLGATDVGQEKFGGDDQMTHDSLWNDADKERQERAS